jgi:nucleoid-associated protein YgaU
MGLIDFVKSAGEMIFGSSEEPEAVGKSPQQVKQEAEATMAAALTRQVEAHGLDCEDLLISFSEDVATVRGRTSSQSEREKIVLVVGNVNGVAQVNDMLEVTAPQAVLYTVQSGDTLSKIAKEHYGDAMKYPVLFEANKPMLKDPDRIYPGQVLRIPPVV